MENKHPILVTGAAGFIGFHTAKALLARGEHVVGVDNFNDYYDVSLKEARAALLLPHPHFTLVRGDLADKTFLQSLFASYSFDIVCHLAAQAGVRYSLENPSAYVESNLVAFVNLLEIIKTTGIKNVVYASSSSVYGENKKVPFSVGDTTDTPLSLYAATKKANELIAYTYYHLYGIALTGLRFFTVLGPYGRPDMAPILFADAITAGRPIKVFNHGQMERDFTYVDDIVAGILQSIDTPNGYRLFNLGNNQPVALEYFITCLETALGKKAEREYLPMQPGDVPRTFADITATTAALNWQPTTSIEAAVEHFVAWYQEYHQTKEGTVPPENI